MIINFSLSSQKKLFMLQFLIFLKVDSHSYNAYNKKITADLLVKVIA